MKKIFITGANGFIGEYLVNYLSEKNYEIYALLRKGKLPSFSLKKNVKIVFGDLTEKSTLKNIVPSHSIIVNLAANPYHPKLSYEVNVNGNKNLIEVAKKMQVRKIIHLSSQSTKIKTQGVYGKTKNESDKLVIASGLKYIILKPSLVYGEGNKGLFNKIKVLIKKIPVIPIFGNGQAKLNPIYVEDLCYLIECLINDSKLENKIFDVGSNEKVTYQQYYQLLVRELHKEVVFVHIPVKLGVFLGNFFSKFLKKPPFYTDNVLGSTQESHCNPSALLQHYKFKPLSFKEGLKKIFRTKKINLAVIGLGKMGTLHLSLINFMKEVNVVALIDTNRQLFNTVKSMGIDGRFYLNLDDALEREKIDAAFVTTPTFTHFDLINKLIKKNISVFIEKPVTLNEKELLALKKIKTNLQIRSGYTLLFKKTFRLVKELIENKKYGKIKSFQANFEHSEVFGPKKGWMFNKMTSGGGVLMNPGPHLFSLINYYFGIPKKITGDLKKKYSSGIEDEANLNFYYDNFKGNVFLSWSVRKREISRTEIKIKFERAKVVVDGEKIVIELNSGKSFVLKENMLAPLLNNVFNINPEANGDAYYIEDRQFIDSLLNKNRNEINSINFAMDTESIIYNIYNSCQTKNEKHQ